MAQSSQRSVESQNLPPGYELEQPKESKQSASGLPPGYTIESEQPKQSEQAGGMTPPPTPAPHANHEPADDGFWHWFFGIGPQYKDKGLVKTGLRKMQEIGKEEAKKRADYRSSREYYDLVQKRYQDQVAHINASKNPEETKKWLLELAAHERDQRLGSGLDAAGEQFAPHAIETMGKLGEQSITPANAAVATAGALVPPLRPVIGGYYAIEGLMTALRPREEEENDADYIERVLMGGSQVASGAAIFKSPWRTAAQERRYRLNKATFATGGGNPEFRVTFDDLDQTLKESPRKVKTVEDVRQLVMDTERRLNQHFEKALFPVRGNKIVPDAVADALEAKANQSNLQMTPEGRREANMYRKAAANYRQEWSLGSLDLERRRLFDARMARKGSVDQSVSRRANISTDIDQIIEDNIRDLEYGELDRRYPNQKFGDLKHRQSQLVELKRTLEKRVETLQNAQAKEKGAPVLAGERAVASVSKHGPIARVYSHLPGQGPETQANTAARKAFKRPGPGRQLPALQAQPQQPPSPTAQPAGGMTPPPAPQAPPAAAPAKAAPAKAAGAAVGKASLEEALERAQRERDIAELGGTSATSSEEEDMGVVIPEHASPVTKDVHVTPPIVTPQGKHLDPPKGISPDFWNNLSLEGKAKWRRWAAGEDAWAGPIKPATDTPTPRLSIGDPSHTGIRGETAHPIMRNGKIVGEAKIRTEGSVATIKRIGPVGYQTGSGEELHLTQQEFLQLRKQFEQNNPGVKLRAGSSGAERRTKRAQTRKGKMTPPPALDKLSDVNFRRSDEPLLDYGDEAVHPTIDYRTQGGILRPASGSMPPTIDISKNAHDFIAQGSGAFEGVNMSARDVNRLASGLEQSVKDNPNHPASKPMAQLAATLREALKRPNAAVTGVDLMSPYNTMIGEREEAFHGGVQRRLSGGEMSKHLGPEAVDRLMHHPVTPLLMQNTIEGFPSYEDMPHWSQVVEMSAKVAADENALPPEKAADWFTSYYNELEKEHGAKNVESVMSGMFDRARELANEAIKRLKGAAESKSRKGESWP